MNLNNSPTTQDLATLLAACNDSAGHHVLWVSNTGDVYINLMTTLSPVGFQAATPSMAMRHETFNQGKDYVGQSAANDAKYVTSLLNTLTTEWPKYNGHSVHYIG